VTENNYCPQAKKQLNRKKNGGKEGKQTDTHKRKDDIEYYYT